jgi:hypothetical protein
MSRRIVLALLFVTTLHLNAQTDLSRRDGNWWIGQSTVFKNAYIGGFFDGMDLGYKFSYWRRPKQNNKNSCMSEVTKSFTTLNEEYFKNVSSRQLADGLDAFYSDYRNRRIYLSNAVWLVTNGIAGTPQKDLDTMIENWRKATTD